MQETTRQDLIGPIESWEQYHPKYVCRAPNPLHDDLSRMLLGMKEFNQAFIRYFADQLNGWLPGEVVICTAPSSNPAIHHNGISQVGQILACHYNRVDGTHVLRRCVDTRNVQRNTRTMRTHLNSIEVIDPNLIRDRTVVMLDDVTTHGHTLRACGGLLYEAGATRVLLRAVAKTVFYNFCRKSAVGV